MSELPKRLVIENKAQGPRYEKDFFLEIQEAIINGYRLAENPYSVDCTMRNFMGYMGRAVFYLPGFEPLKGEPKGVAREVSSLEEQPVEKVEVVVEEPVETSEDVKEESEVEPQEVEETPVEEVTEAPEDDTTNEESTEEVDLESLTKKKDLLDYAEKAGIEVPSDFKNAPQIKKFIKENQDK